jgi:uncharacterized protein
MKLNYIFVLSILLTAFMHSHAQTLDTRKFIEVTGSAEMNISPDELELEIQLQEYDKMGRKVQLDDVNGELQRVLRKNHIDTSSLVFIRSSDYYWWYWWYQRDRYYQTKTISLKLTNKTNILKLVEDLHEKWVQSIRIAKSSHSKIYDYRKQVKKEATKMAKEKAVYLLESLGEELGNVLSIEEVPEAANNSYWNSNLRSNYALANSSVSTGENSNAVNSVADIKLRYEVKVKFAIR